MALTIRRKVSIQVNKSWGEITWIQHRHRRQEKMTHKKTPENQNNDQVRPENTLKPLRQHSEAPNVPNNHQTEH